MCPEITRIKPLSLKKAQSKITILNEVGKTVTRTVCLKSSESEKHVYIVLSNNTMFRWY